MEVLFCGGVLLLFFVGSVMYMRSRDMISQTDGLGHMAGWLTLKPLLTTPIWILTGVSPFGLIPAVGITLVIILAYRHLLVGARARGAARVLIGLDCLRWGNSLFMSLFGLGNTSSTYDTSLSGVLSLSALVGVALPFVYVIVALVCVSVSKPPQVDNWTWDNKPKRKPKSEPAEIYMPDEPEQIEMIFEDEPEKPKRGDGETF